MKKKMFISGVMAIMISLSPANVFAAEDYPSDETAFNRSISTLGLIDDYLNECTVGTKKVHLKLETVGSETMDTIGFKNIVIQRSSNRTSWTNERYVSDQLINGSYIYTIYDLPVWVNGGYYYRAYVEHYAKSYGGSEETIGDYSNYVWVG